MNYPKRLVVLAILLTGLILVPLAGYYWWQGQQIKEENLEHQTITNQNLNPFTSQPRTRPSASPTPISTDEAASLTDIPKLYSGLSWQKKSSSRSTYPYELRIDQKKRFSLTEGEEWETDRMNLDAQEDIKVGEDFNAYYESAFLHVGWKPEIMVNGILIEAPAAAGPEGLYNGFIGIKGGKLRAVVFRKVSEAKGTNYLGVKNIVCPCDDRFIVFLSDIIPLENIPLLKPSP